MLLKEDSENLQDIRARLKMVIHACVHDLVTEGSGFWDHKNLLRYAISYSVDTTLQCFDSVRDDIDAERSVPVAIVARSMFEHLVTFEYCVMDCPDALVLWVKELLKNHINFLSDYLRHDAEIDPWRVNREPRAKQEKTRTERLLARAPENVSGALPNLKEMRKVVFGANPDKERIYRLSYRYPSGWVHSKTLGIPEVGVLAETARFSMWLIINRAMRICVDNDLVGWEDRNRAQGIINVCEQHAPPDGGSHNANGA